MVVYCTYCSSKKNKASQLMPAIKRYKSNRISAVHRAALTQSIPFLILSGKHGLLKPIVPIHYYNYLLKSDDILEHSKKVAEQLVKLGVQELVFFTEPIEKDKNIISYINCMKNATIIANVKFKLINIS